MKHLSSRLRNLEPKAPPPVNVPHVLEMRPGETIEEAFARFHVMWPNVRQGHRLMAVPATVTPAEFRLLAARRRTERQRALASLNSEKDALL